MNIHRKFMIISGSIFITLFCSAALATQADIDAEKKELIRVFSGESLAEMEISARSLEDKGLSDPAIFDMIEKVVLDNQNVIDAQQLDSVAWLIRALGFSGNEKYLATLNALANSGSKKLKRHAASAIKDMPTFAQLNAVRGKDLDKAPAGRLDQQRALNMLNSGDDEAVRNGVKRVYDAYSKGDAYDKVLVDKVNELLLAEYKSAYSEKREDALAWMCKVLAESGMPEYVSTLNEVAENAATPKLKKYASKYVSRL